MRSAIEVRDLTVLYKGAREVTAVKELSFKVQPREFVCLLGTTGCGKTTTLNAIAGFMKPALGEVLVNGRQVQGPSSDVGFVFQRHALFPWKTVAGNVEFGPKMRGIGKHERKRIARRCIRMVGLAGFERSYPHELSGGMEQRVGIARALANEPRMLLMDEPFGSLDAQTRIMMEELLLGIWERLRKTIVFVTHDIDEAILLADRILVLTASPGRVKKEICVALPRPRDYGITLTRRFAAIKKEIMGLIREEAIQASACKTIYHRT
jgi:NitT/TauT family transport system ATP-binding protein